MARPFMLGHTRRPWWEGLDPETIRELRHRHPTLSLEELAVAAVRHPDWAVEFKRLDAEVFEDPEEEEVADLALPREPHEARERVWVPPANAGAFRNLVASAMLETDAAQVGRPVGSEVPIPEDTLMEALRLAVEEHASARTITTTTDASPDLRFVNRIKASVILAWVKAHEDEAKRAVAGRKIPASFPATEGGYLLPKS